MLFDSHDFYTNNGKVSSELIENLEEIKKKIKSSSDEISHSLEVQNKLLNVIESRTERIEKLSAETYSQIFKTEEVLRTSIFEATEVTIPTCFVILK